MGSVNKEGVVSRPDWDTYFFRMATMIATRSTCPSRAVGCVVIDIDTKHVLSTGYNGAPKGTAHCDEGCLTRESGKNWGKCRAKSSRESIAQRASSVLHAASKIR